jgi:hypothetical protein
VNGQELSIALDRLLFLPNMPAGMDWAVIGLHVCHFRKTAAPCDPPIVVEPIGDTGLYRVLDGRHRTIAAYIAGRTHIEYTHPPLSDRLR